MKSPVPEKPALIMGVVSFVVAALFVPCLFNEFVNWDDPFYIIKNPYVHHPEQFQLTDLLFTPLLGYPLPLQIGVYRALNALFGLNPLPFHLFNIAIHALSSALLTRLLCRFAAPHIAFLSALLFALHPVAVEPVAWATGLKDLLVLFFSLMAINALFDALDTTFRRGSVPILLVATVLAVMSKPTAISLLPCLIIATFLFGPAQRASKAGIAASIAAGLLLWVLFVVAGTHGERGMPTLARFGDLETYLIRILEAALCQLEHLFLPLGLLPVYPVDLNAFHWRHLIPAGVIAGAGVVMIYAFRRQQKGVLFFLAFTVLYYVPVSNAIPLNRFTSDSYLYAPLAGIAGLVALMLQAVAARIPDRRHYQTILKGMVAAYILVLSLVTLKQQRIWKDTDTLWRPVARAYPHNLKAMEHYTNGLVYLGRMQEALEIYRQNESVWLREGWIPPAYIALLAELGHTDKALYLFSWAVEKSNYKKETIEKNFIKFLLNTGTRPTGEALNAARAALPVFIADLPLDTTPAEQLAHIAGFAGDMGAYAVAEAVLLEAVRKRREPSYIEMGLAACRMQQKPGCEAKWSSKK